MRLDPRLGPSGARRGESADALLVTLTMWRTCARTARSMTAISCLGTAGLTRMTVSMPRMAASSVAASFTAWAAAIREGLLGMRANGTLCPRTDVDRLALALLAAVQGGLLLAQAQRTTDALEAGLDTVIAHIGEQAAARPTPRVP